MLLANENLQFATKISSICPLVATIWQKPIFCGGHHELECKTNCSRVTSCHPAEICSGRSNLPDTMIKHCIYPKTCFSILPLDYNKFGMGCVENMLAFKKKKLQADLVKKRFHPIKRIYLLLYHIKMFYNKKKNVLH